MAVPPEGPEPTADDVGPDEPTYAGPPPGAPRWVKIAGIVAAVIVVLVVVLLLTGRLGEHGPGRHGPGRHGQGDDATTTLAADATPLSGDRG